MTLVSCTCEHCGKRFDRARSNINKRQFCSVECFRLTAKKEGKEKRRRGQAWEKMRLLALKRDNYTCQECGKKDGRIQVHHMDGSSAFGEDANNKLENLVTLCSRCHRQCHALNPRKVKLSRRLGMIVKRLKNGSSVRDIADKCNVSRQAIYKLLSDNKIDIEEIKNNWPDYLTLDIVAEKYHIPIPTLRDWIKRRLLTAHQIAPRAKIYIDPLEIPSWIRKEKP